MTAISDTSLQALKQSLDASKMFAVDTLRITPSSVCGVDEPPSIVVFVDPSSPYEGPELWLNRLKTLSARLDTATSVEVVTNTAGNPYSLNIQAKRNITYDFVMGAASRSMPTKVPTEFEHTLTISRDDLLAAVEGARNVKGSTLTVSQKGGVRKLFSQEEGETFTMILGENFGTSQFSFNYSVDHLHVISKCLPKDGVFEGNITQRGHMLVNLEPPGLSAGMRVFILDIKNR